MYAPISAAVLLIGIHGVGGERDIGRLLAPPVGWLLVLHDRKRPDRGGPRGQAAVREVAVDAPHRGLAERRGRLEHLPPVSRAGVLGIDQHGKARPVHAGKPPPSQSKFHAPPCRGCAPAFRPPSQAPSPIPRSGRISRLRAVSSAPPGALPGIYPMPSSAAMRSPVTAWRWERSSAASSVTNSARSRARLIST